MRHAATVAVKLPGNTTKRLFCIDKEEFNNYTLVKAHHQRVPADAVPREGVERQCPVARGFFDGEGLIFIKEEPICANVCYPYLWCWLLL